MENELCNSEIGEARRGSGAWLDKVVRCRSGRKPPPYRVIRGGSCASWLFVRGTGAVLDRGFVADICHRVRHGHALPQRQQRAQAPRQRLEIPHLRPLLGVRERRVNHVREGRGVEGWP